MGSHEIILLKVKLLNQILGISFFLYLVLKRFNGIQNFHYQRRRFGIKKKRFQFQVLSPNQKDPTRSEPTNTDHLSSDEATNMESHLAAPLALLNFISYLKHIEAYK